MTITPGIYRPGETWKPVAGFEGFYEVSDQGRVRSLDRTIYGKKTMRVKGRVLKPQVLQSSGHLLVSLQYAGRLRAVLLHRLVLETFVGPCPAGMEGCHFDDIPANNTIGNLRWDTRSKNQRDAVRNGTHSNTRKTRCPRNHLYDLEMARSDGRSYRGCSRCRRIANDQFNARQKRVAA